MPDGDVYILAGRVGDFVERLASGGIDRVAGLVGCDELVINDVAREDLNQVVSTRYLLKPMED